ncbi:MAG: sigma-70 family RNA polymerase sigma factor [Acidobacteriia bacterium]|nr:sigma-70 family RNA polymerase sigma factor [Terriglobia bacterium]
MNDAELIRRAREGEETAFLLLYERYRKGIYSYALRLLGSNAAAEDIMHDCFASVIRNFSRFDPGRASLRTYLYAAAHNLARKYLRDPDNDAAEELPVDLPGPTGPLDQLLDNELCEVVKSAVGSLPARQREVLVLAEYEELPLAEVAVIVGADLGSVKARLHRARTNLRRLLTPYFNGNSDPQNVEEL